jgi:hypothetical protein
MIGSIHIISLGAGVQSSTMALMAAHGEITPMPKCAIFADTGDEPSEIYEYLEYLKPLLPFPVEHIKRDSRGIAHSRLSEHIREKGQSQIPSFVMGAGGVGLGKRQCTAHWKIEPLHREFRKIAGITGQRTTGVQVVSWPGISLDEIIRAKPSRDHWLERRFPLLEKRMRRYNCETWLRNNGYKIPHKSACVYCPYRSDRQWAASKSKGGAEWAKILRVSNELALHGEFLTPECKPIEECDFSTDEDHGQQVMFGNECEGMCGV